MNKITTKYENIFKTISIHENSGEIIKTAAPLDNQKKGEYFSPTDLFATAITACIFTITGQAAKTSGFSIEGAKAVTEKKMSTEFPRRISEIIINFDFSMCSLDDKAQKIIKKISENCPVSLSLHPNIIKSISFKF